jgi:pimeloyl-ACP methyl ester carboxylesterase
MLSGIVSILAAPLGAQRPELAVFVVRLGHDTLAVENASFASGRAEGDLRYRTPLVRVHRVLTLSPDFELQAADITAGGGAGGDSARSHSVLTVSGDSGVIRIDDPSGAAPPQARRLAVQRGSVPFNNLSGLTLELVLRRARAIGGEAVTVPLLLASGQSLPMRVTRMGADSAVLTVGGVDLRVRTDGVGRFLGAVVPAQGVYFDRLPGDSPAAMWRPVVMSYEAPSGAPYTAEPVTIRTPAGITLSGTLTLPSYRASLRIPAVVLITGSGSQDRDEGIPSIGNYRPFREIADTLSRRGIAVLRLDDRGVGGSSQGPPTATSSDFADDIRAALAWLRTREDIDPERLGLVGHSEGGMIAPMIAVTDPKLRALVIIAGPAKTGRAISASQRRYVIGHEPSLPPEKRDSIFAAAERASEVVYAAPGWINFYVNYDPLPTARRVRVPALILQGETDAQVTPEQAGMLAAAMREGGNRNVTVRAFPRMDHLMLEDASGNPSGYGKLASYAVRRDFLGVLADWLANTL